MHAFVPVAVRITINVRQICLRLASKDFSLFVGGVAIKRPVELSVYSIQVLRQGEVLGLGLDLYMDKGLMCRLHVDVYV